MISTNNSTNPRKLPNIYPTINISFILYLLLLLLKLWEPHMSGLPAFKDLLEHLA